MSKKPVPLKLILLASWIEAREQAVAWALLITVLYTIGLSVALVWSLLN